MNRAQKLSLRDTPGSLLVCTGNREEREIRWILAISFMFHRAGNPFDSHTQLVTCLDPMQPFAAAE